MRIALCNTVEVKATSFRLPESSIEQLAKLAAQLGMTATQVIVVALDRMFQQENSK
jgi:predicted DNA-binding protein